MSRYQSVVLGGRAYAATTPVAGVAPGTAIGTSAAFALYNPIGSGVYAVLWRVSMGYISGTLGAGSVSICSNSDTSAPSTTGTALTVLPCFIGNLNGVGNQVQAFSPATLPVAPTQLRPLWNLNAMSSATATQPEIEDVELSGEFVIAPGATLSLEAVAGAGSAPLVLFGATWAEIPIEDWHHGSHA